MRNHLAQLTTRRSYVEQIASERFAKEVDDEDIENTRESWKRTGVKLSKEFHLLSVALRCI